MSVMLSVEKKVSIVTKPTSPPYLLRDSHSGGRCYKEDGWGRGVACGSIQLYLSRKFGV